MKDKKSGLNSVPPEPAPNQNTQQQSNSIKTKSQLEKSKIISLPIGNQVPKDELYSVGSPTHRNNNEYVDDINNLSKTALSKKYSRTYKCWDNMKQRKKIGFVIHQDFDDFTSFLRHVGPCENKKYTLDRLDNSDREYAPGKVEWRDKYAQNSNKGNNIFLTHDDARCFTVAQWAAITDQKPGTLYKRRQNGWSDMEIITGVRATTNSSALSSPFPYDKKEAWEKRYIEKVGCGYEKTELEFLNEETYKLIDVFAEEAADLENRILHHELNDPDNTELVNLKKKLKVANDKYDKCRKIYDETFQQLEYGRRKEALLARCHHNKKVLGNLKANYDKLYPRPEYSINQPGSD